MGLKSQVGGIWLAKREVARTAVLDAPVTGTILTITGGLVRIHGIYCYCITSLDDAGAGTTFVVAVNGVPMNAPAFAVAPVIAGDILVFPMGAFAVAAGAPAQQSPNVAALTAFSGVSIVAGPVTGIILLTVAAGALVAGELCSFKVVYERIDAEALIS